MNVLHTVKPVRSNAKTWGNRFVSRFIEPGLISYEDVGGDVELLSKETLDAYAQSFVGRPVVVKHRKVSPQTMEGVAGGYITRVWFEPTDGWYWCEGIMTGDECKDLIRRGWSVSCSYHVTNTDERGGVYHNIRYRREITAFDGEHLAIVENPRYEGATIRLNSKQPKENVMFKLFKKKAVAPSAAAALAAAAAAPAAPAAPAADEKRENTLAADSLIEIAEGQKVKLSDLIERYNSKPADSEEISPESTIEIAGKPVTVAQLVERWNTVATYSHESVKRHDNESDEDYKKRCHDFDEDEKKKKDRDNSGASFYRVLAAAPQHAAATFKVEERHNSADTLTDKVERGRQRYGSGHGVN